MTGLPEYRNGGLLVDTGLLTLKKDDLERGLDTYRRNAADKGEHSMEKVPLFEPADDVVVEWRAATVGFLDELLEDVNRGLSLKGGDCLSLAQMLEAGTWKVSNSFPLLVIDLIGNREAVSWQQSLDQTRKTLQLEFCLTERSSNSGLALEANIRMVDDLDFALHSMWSIEECVQIMTFSATLHLLTLHFPPS